MKLSPKIHVIYSDHFPETYERVILFIGITQISYGNGFKEDLDFAMKMAARLSPNMPVERDQSLDHFIMDAGIGQEFDWLLRASLFNGAPTKDFVDERGLPETDGEQA